MIGAFLLISPLLSHFLTSNEGRAKFLINGWVLVVAGAVTFFIAAFADRRNGIDWKSLNSWTGRLLVSEHTCFHVPMRLFAVAEFLAGMALFALYFGGLA